MMQLSFGLMMQPFADDYTYMGEFWKLTFIFKFKITIFEEYHDNFQGIVIFIIFIHLI